ncbi:uncharacterized protein [Triticum aestivum]|uniref:uncharacterized protein n=1 Tax=Triticum aestivum TaxID=4565 RepID=UPI001D02F514|nr:uncharacterized protein LOC123090445 [Triticum aestivum]
MEGLSSALKRSDLPIIVEMDSILAVKLIQSRDLDKSIYAWIVKGSPPPLRHPPPNPRSPHTVAAAANPQGRRTPPPSRITRDAARCRRGSPRAWSHCTRQSVVAVVLSSSDLDLIPSTPVTPLWPGRPWPTPSQPTPASPLRPHALPPPRSRPDRVWCERVGARRTCAATSRFGEILKVVIADKGTGRSKGGGFEAEAAIRACLGPYPVIDGRRANCNLACLEVQGATTKTPASILSFKGCVLPRVVPSHRHNELPCNPASALRHLSWRCHCCRTLTVHALTHRFRR